MVYYLKLILKALDSSKAVHSERIILGIEKEILVLIIEVDTCIILLLKCSRGNFDLHIASMLLFSNSTL